MLWSVHSLKLHELFMYWHPTWHSSTSTNRSLASWIIQRSNKQPIPVYSQQKIFVTLSESQLATSTLTHNGNTLIRTATSQASLTKPGHSFSQKQILSPNMKDDSSILNQEDEQASNYYKKVQDGSASRSHNSFYKRLKTEDSAINQSLTYSSFSIPVAHQPTMIPIDSTYACNSGSSSNTLSSAVPSYDVSGLYDKNVYCLDNKAERLASKVLSIRTWDMSPVAQKTDNSPGSSSSKQLDFKLMSYNILAQELLEQNSYLYHHCDGRVLNWSYRSTHLLNEIIESDSDIMCFQEMQIDLFETFFQPEMSKLGFESIYKKRTGDKSDGCAIFFRKSAFYLEMHKEVEYNQPSVGLLDRDNIGIIAVFRPILENGEVCNKVDDPKLCVATTHLLFNPRRGDIKLAQLQIMLAELDKISFKKISESTGRPIYHPIVLCGDMNSEPYSPLYKFLTRGSLNYCGLQTGDVSGQHDGALRGRRLGVNEIELSQLGITSDCQYQVTNKDREAECEDSNTGEKSKEVDTESHRNVGQLCHSFNLVSAYDHHDSNGIPFITTHHRKSCSTVDYIFYSNPKKCSPKSSPKRSGSTNDPITLLETYRLLSYLDTKTIGGLPNAVQSSDHLSLIAKFRLRIPYR